MIKKLHMKTNLNLVGLGTLRALYQKTKFDVSYLITWYTHEIYEKYQYKIINLFTAIYLFLH